MSSKDNNDPQAIFAAWLSDTRHQLAKLSEAVGENKMSVQRSGPTLDQAWLLEQLFGNRAAGMSLRDETMILRALVCRIFLGLPADNQTAILADVKESITAVCDGLLKASNDKPAPKPKIITPGQIG